MSRQCVRVEFNDLGGPTKIVCPFYRTNPNPKILCNFIEKVMTFSPNPIQKFCPIKSGSGALVKFDYEKLVKYSGHPSWKKVLKAEDNRKFGRSKDEVSKR